MRRRRRQPPGLQGQDSTGQDEGEEFGMASPSSSAPSATTGDPPPQPPGAVPLAMPVSPQPKGKDTLMEA
jgi:hypothetical protein